MVQHICDLPEDLRRQTAALVEHGSLPDLRLVNRGWNEAANLAVCRLGHHLRLFPDDHERARLIGQRWPNLAWLDLNSQPGMERPGKKCGGLLSSLMLLTRLQDLALSLGAALLPEGQEFMLRQTQLLSLRVCGTYGRGASDGLLQTISKLSHLTRLECGLQGEHSDDETLRGVLLEPATNEGVRCLSSLQSLQDLTLTSHSRFPAVTGQALSSIEPLHQLTHLSLVGWRMVDADLACLTHLQLWSLDLDCCPMLTSGCLRHVCLITSLRCLCLVESGDWWSSDLEEFEALAH